MAKLYNLEQRTTNDNMLPDETKDLESSIYIVCSLNNFIFDTPFRIKGIKPIAHQQSIS